MKIIYWLKTFFRHLIHYSYPKEIIILLDRQYDKIYKHERKIRNIKNFIKKYDPYGDEKKYVHAMKNHKYLINKAKKEIQGIKKYYKDSL